MENKTIKLTPAMEAELLREANQRLQDVITDEYDSRVKALQDFKFAHGEQWPEALRRQREEDGRPCLTHNRIRRFVKSVVGDQRQNRLTPRFLPVDSGSDPATCQIIESLHRHVWNNSGGDAAIDTAFEHAFTCGFGFWRLLHDFAHDDDFHQDIMIQTVHNPFSVYIDQGHKKQDFTDLRYAFVTEHMPMSAFEEEYGGAGSSVSSGVGDYDEGQWLSEETVRVAEYYYVINTDDVLYLLPNLQTVYKSEYDEEIHGQWIDERKAKKRKVMWLKFCPNRILEGPLVTPSRYIPIIPVFGDMININGKREYKGGIRDSEDGQKMYNFWSSTVAETLSLQSKSPIIVDRESIEGFEAQWDTHNVRPWPYLPFDGSKTKYPPTRLDPPPIPQGFIENISRSEEDMKATSGITDAGLGNRTNEVSGRAILARQKESDTTTYSFVDNLTRALKYHGKVFIDMIPHIYDSERVIRLEAEDGSTEIESINKAVLEGEDIKILNDLTVGRYDVRVSIGPSYMTQRLEAMESLMEFARAFPMSAPLIPDLAAENLDFKNADRFAARLRALLPPQIIDAEENQKLIKDGKAPEGGSAIGQPQGQQPEEKPKEGGGQPPQLDMLKMQLLEQKGRMELMKLQLDLKRLEIQTQADAISLRSEEVMLQRKQVELSGVVDQATEVQAARGKQVIQRVAEQSLAKVLTESQKRSQGEIPLRQPEPSGSPGSRS